MRPATTSSARSRSERHQRVPGQPDDGVGRRGGHEHARGLHGLGEVRAEGRRHDLVREQDAHGANEHTCRKRPPEQAAKQPPATFAFVGQEQRQTGEHGEAARGGEDEHGVGQPLAGGEPGERLGAPVVGQDQGGHPGDEGEGGRGHTELQAYAQQEPPGLGRRALNGTDVRPQADQGDERARGPPWPGGSPARSEGRHRAPGPRPPQSRRRSHPRPVRRPRRPSGPRPAGWWPQS